MRNTRRNIADPISPQNPVIEKEITDQNRIQDHLEDKVHIEDIITPADTDKNRKADDKPFKGSNDTNLEDES